MPRAGKVIRRASLPAIRDRTKRLSKLLAENGGTGNGDFPIQVVVTPGLKEAIRDHVEEAVMVRMCWLDPLDLGVEEDGICSSACTCILLLSMTFRAADLHLLAKVLVLAASSITSMSHIFSRTGLC